MKVKHFKRIAASWYDFAYSEESQLDDVEVLIYKNKSGLFCLDSMENLVGFATSFREIIKMAEITLSYPNN